MTGCPARRREKPEMSSALATRISQDHAIAGSSLPEGVIALGRRREAVNALEKHGLPTIRDENWKYANLRPLEKVRFAPAPRRLSSDAALAAVPAPLAGHSRYTFIDGVFAPELSQPADRAGISVKSLRERAVSSSQPIAPDARFALLNEAFATDGASIHVAAGAVCESCLEILFIATTDAQTGASYPRVELRVGSGARFGLIERHVSAGGEFVNGVVDIEVGPGASVTHYRVQQTGARALWFDTLSATLAQDSKYSLHTISLGALTARSTVNILLAGERSEVGVYAASVADLHQTQDHFVLVEHVVPRALTNQVFRGIAAGRARVGFNGKIIVRKDARGTDSRQSLRGLLAGPEAEIDVRPQLEIYTDDVKCSHGATAGKLDDNMLFYLLSRGLDRDTAQRLLQWAFLEDVVAKIEVPELRRQIEQSLAGHLHETAVLKELI